MGAIIRNRMLFVIAMTACFSMIFLNESGAIAVTFPTMQQELNFSNNALNWVMNSFLLTAAILLLLGGKLADHYGHRKVFLIGMCLFLFASAVCASTEIASMMIAGRILQAIGASLIYPSGSALISTSFSESEFPKVYGSIMSIAYFFVAFGPFIGGFFTDFLNWHWIFWINVPVSALCILLVIYNVSKEQENLSRTPLDFKGLFILMIGLGALVVGLMQGPVWGWSDLKIIGLFILAVIGLFLFVKVELKTEYPLLDLKLFSNKLFLAGNIIFPCTAACFTALVFWAIWLQQTFDYSPLIAGAAMIPATVISLFMLRISGNWGSVSGPRPPMLLGGILLFIGMLWIAISALAQNYWILVWGFLFFGFGTPLIIPNSIGVIMSAVHERVRGVASGVYLTLQHVAFTFGFAILAAVISTHNNKQLSEFLNSHSEYQHINLHEVSVLLSGKNIISGLSPDKATALKQSAIQIYTHAFSLGMLAMAVFALIVLIFTFFWIPKTNKASM